MKTVLTADDQGRTDSEDRANGWSRVVKVLLQSTETLGYVSGDGNWTADVRRAFAFDGVVDVMDYALSHGLSRVRAVLKCEDPKLDLPLPSLPARS